MEAALGIIDVDDTVAKLAKTLAYFIICIVGLDVIIGQKVDLVWSLWINYFIWQGKVMTLTTFF